MWLLTVLSCCLCDMEDARYLRTDMFEHRHVGEHFINPCSFGEDFALWLVARVGVLKAAGFRIGDPIQEDYGWGFYVSRDKLDFWVALSYAEEGPVEHHAHWVVSVAYEAGLNPIRRIFGKLPVEAFSQVRNAVFEAVEADAGIQVLTEDEWAMSRGTRDTGSR